METLKWNTEMDGRLRAFVTSGKSYGQIAKEFGTTRSAIAGRCNRIGLKASSQPLPPKPDMPLEYGHVPPVQDPPPAGVTFRQLRDSHCRFPINNGKPEYFFCGEQQLPGESYCEFHYFVTHEVAANA